MCYKQNKSYCTYCEVPELASQIFLCWFISSIKIIWLVGDILEMLPNHLPHVWSMFEHIEKVVAGIRLLVCQNLLGCHIQWIAKQPKSSIPLPGVLVRHLPVPGRDTARKIHFITCNLTKKFLSILMHSRKANEFNFRDTKVLPNPQLADVTSYSMNWGLILQGHAYFSLLWLYEFKTNSLCSYFVNI